MMKKILLASLSLALVACEQTNENNTNSTLQAHIEEHIEEQLSKGDSNYVSARPKTKEVEYTDADKPTQRLSLKVEKLDNTPISYYLEHAELNPQALALYQGKIQATEGTLLLLLELIQKPSTPSDLLPFYTHLATYSLAQVNIRKGGSEALSKQVYNVIDQRPSQVWAYIASTGSKKEAVARLFAREVATILAMKPKPVEMLFDYEKHLHNACFNCTEMQRDAMNKFLAQLHTAISLQVPMESEDSNDLRKQSGILRSRDERQKRLERLERVKEAKQH